MEWTERDMPQINFRDSSMVVGAGMRLEVLDIENEFHWSVDYRGESLIGGKVATLAEAKERCMTEAILFLSRQAKEFSDLAFHLGAKAGEMYMNDAAAKG